MGREFSRRLRATGDAEVNSAGQEADHYHGDHRSPQPVFPRVWIVLLVAFVNRFEHSKPAFLAGTIHLRDVKGKGWGRKHLARIGPFAAFLALVLLADLFASRGVSLYFQGHTIRLLFRAVYE